MTKTLIFIAFILLSCSDDDNDNSTQTNCEFETIVNADQYVNAPSDVLVINDLQINNDCLTINFSSSGCNGNTWEIKLIDSEGVYESSPLQRNLRLSLNNEELCGSFITKTATFDISNLQVEGEIIQLNITNSDESILYEY